MQGRQRSAIVAGEAELEVTVMELEEAEASEEEPAAKGSKVAAASEGEDVEPHAKVRSGGPPDTPCTLQASIQLSQCQTQPH